MADGVLIREVMDSEDRKQQIVLPGSCINKVLHYIHSDMGHPGKYKTLTMARDRFFWFGAASDVDHFIENYRRCVLRKTPTTEKAPLTSIHTYQQLEWSASITWNWSREKKKNIKDVLVITEHFTKYAQAIPTRHQTARTTAEVLFNHYIVHYDIPATLHSN